MALDLAQLKAAFAKKSETSGGENTGFWDKFYPFYKMGFDETVVFRFLPDLDDENPLAFIVENMYHKFKVNGQDKRVACLKMYGEKCPACDLSKQFYDQGNNDMGLMFWRKIDYIAQGLVLSSPFEYPIAPTENPVRMVSLMKKIYKKIETEIVKGDMDQIPWDLVNGYNFNINKTKQGEYADYSGSAFARRSSAIPEDLIARMELHDLKKFRYAKVEREQIEAMIEAALTGKSYEAEKGAASPAVQAAINAPKAAQPAEAVVQAMTQATPAAAPTAAEAGGQKLSASEILKKLKERSAAQQSK